MLDLEADAKTPTSDQIVNNNERLRQVWGFAGHRGGGGILNVESEIPALVSMLSRDFPGAWLLPSVLRALGQVCLSVRVPDIRHQKTARAWPAP